MYLMQQLIALQYCVPVSQVLKRAWQHKTK